jgi:hypothetical protein
VIVPLYSIRNASPFWSFFLWFSGPPEQSMISSQRSKPLTESLRPGTPDDEPTIIGAADATALIHGSGYRHNRLAAISSPASPTTQSCATPVRGASVRSTHGVNYTDSCSSHAIDGGPEAVGTKRGYLLRPTRFASSATGHAGPSAHFSYK